MNQISRDSMLRILRDAAEQGAAEVHFKVPNRPLFRMPNGALATLAGNIDPHHRVAVADLILVQQDVAGTVRRLAATIPPWTPPCGRGRTAWTSSYGAKARSTTAPPPW
jgi:hypothetical protein